MCKLDHPRGRCELRATGLGGGDHHGALTVESVPRARCPAEAANAMLQLLKMRAVASSY
eukprot:SAG11_NODE_1318_length_5212_cov_3.462351_2_plen_59_part_00